MWAQLITAKIKPGCEEELDRLYREVDARMSREAGWLCSYSLRSTRNPLAMTALVLFESEARAREYERSPEQAELTGRLGNVLEEYTGFADFDLVTKYEPQPAATTV